MEEPGKSSCIASHLSSSHKQTVNGESHFFAVHYRTKVIWDTLGPQWMPTRQKNSLISPHNLLPLLRDWCKDKFPSRLLTCCSPFLNEQFCRLECLHLKHQLMTGIIASIITITLIITTLNAKTASSKFLSRLMSAEEYN